MIGFLVAGLVIGLLARLLLPGRQKIGLLWTLLLGVIGSLIGGTIAHALNTGAIWGGRVLAWGVWRAGARRRSGGGGARPAHPLICFGCPLFATGVVSDPR